MLATMATVTSGLLSPNSYGLNPGEAIFRGCRAFASARSSLETRKGKRSFLNARVGTGNVKECTFKNGKESFITFAMFRGIFQRPRDINSDECDDSFSKIPIFYIIL
jgi:hypothetical protein